ADCVHIVGFTARGRTAKRNLQRPREAAAELVALAEGGGGPVALLFGREDKGLSNDALDRCHRVVTIPSDPSYASLNLGHAVIIPTGFNHHDECMGARSRITRSSGCRVCDENGRVHIDFFIALGAVALGYGHPDVNRAATAAIAAGVVGPLPPVAEEELAEALAEKIPWLERVRFLKTGAEAVAAAVRLARVATGRDDVLGCGYHGWLDWSQGATEGVPAAVRN